MLVVKMANVERKVLMSLKKKKKKYRVGRCIREREKSRLLIK
jgi:hypothetical protein